MKMDVEQTEIPPTSDLPQQSSPWSPNNRQGPPSAVPCVSRGPLTTATMRGTLALCLLLAAESVAFTSSPIVSLHPSAAQRPRISSSSLTSVAEASEHRQERVERSYSMSLEDSNPLIRIGKDDKEQKTINAYGLWCAVATLLTVPFWSVAMTMLNFVNQQPFAADWDPNRAIYDGTGKLWSKAWLSMIGCFPSLSGDIDLLKEGGHGPCLYVANHASWLDIPILCTVLDPVFKFIAKGELKQVPCIGQQLEGGDHILIDREDRRSQLRTFKEGISWLRKGVPLMAFPEGKRSDDGRLIDFKGGLFSMAVKTGVPIVPLTISHAHAVMPSHALLPVQSGRGKLHVHVHAPIDSTGRTDAELSELVRKVFLSDLPLDHHPKGEEETTLLSTSAEEPVIQIPTLAQHPVAHHESAHSDTIRHAAINPAHHATTTTPTAVNDGHAAIPHSAIDANDDVTEKV